MRKAGTALLAVVLALGLASCGEPTRVEAGSGDDQSAESTASQKEHGPGGIECRPDQKEWRTINDVAPPVGPPDEEWSDPERSLRTYVKNLSGQSKLHEELAAELPPAAINGNVKPGRGFYKRAEQEGETRTYAYARGNRVQWMAGLKNFNGEWIVTGEYGCESFTG